ncbi:GNAT family N-acetyltransferase [Paractinoplanes rhizophilus]|uniref:GNAT family N-acetyltransferase n=1 Tax=Paractinoplanes rhizophilus TaxID=1416877 RepID=A0ABW2HNW9_9ACTN
MTSVALGGGYWMAEGPPAADDYLTLREQSGLTPRRRDQAEAAVHGSWCGVHVIHEETDTVVAMGRVIGDGGCYFHIVDVAVLPEHQRRGLGNAVLTALMESIRAGAPPGAYVNLLADEPGRPLYRRHGFEETAPFSVGMARML